MNNEQKIDEQRLLYIEKNLEFALLNIQETRDSILEKYPDASRFCIRLKPHLNGVDVYAYMAYRRNITPQEIQLQQEKELKNQQARKSLYEELKKEFEPEGT